MIKNWIGKSVARIEGKSKVTGAAQYADDLFFPELLHGTTVRSPAARGRLRNIFFEGNIPWREFTIVTAKDIPGKNRVALIVDDQPYLAEKEIRHPEEAVVLLAHPDKILLEEARRSVRLDIEPLPGVFTLEESLKKKEIICGTDNVMKSYLIEKGDVASVWEKAHKIVEGEYSTGAQEQLYIENQGMTAVFNPQEGVTVWGTLQCPYYIHKALMALFNLPAEQVRIIQTETGGGFGGKEEYPSVIAGHAALLAWKSGKSVKIIYDRAEDMAATTKRHPSRTRFKTAVDQNGKLLAQEIDFVIDGGAYVTLSPVVLSRGALHATGPYFCPHVRVKAAAVATNTPPHGAFRGFGAPQSLFALERHMNKTAAAVGLSPEEFRRRNFLKDGDTMATGQIVRDGVDLNRLMEKALQVSDYRERREKSKKENQNNPIKRGIGLASFMHGAGFTGSGEKYLASKVAVEATPQGRIRVLTSCTEMGQGKNTIFAQIAADALGLPPEWIDVINPDTAEVPNSGPTVASRTSMVVGDLVGRAAVQIKQELTAQKFLKEKFFPSDFKNACVAYFSKNKFLKKWSEYQVPPGISWSDETYRGDAYATYAWAVYVAQVRVDLITYEITVEDFWAVQEVGKVLNPVLAAGQIEGGVAQGIGWALYEKVVWREGRMANNQMTNYIIPTAADIPRIHVFFEEVPYAHGFSGAKGIGELPMDGPAPAILNAVEEAVGVRFNHIPVLPEDLMEALEKK